MTQKKKIQPDFGQFRRKNQNGKPDEDPKKGNGFNFYWIYIVLIAVIFGIQLLGMMNNAAKKSSFNELTTYLLSEDVEKIRVVNSKEIQVFIRHESIKNKEEFKDLRNRSTGSGVVPGPHLVFQMPGDAFRDELRSFYEENTQLDRRKVPVTYEEQRDYWSDILAWILPFLFIFLIWMFIMRRMSSMGGGPGGQIFNIGKSKAQLFDKNTNVKVTFKDVAGMEGAKEEIQEIVNFLKNPEKYTNLGGKIPKGALLAGPPGTGKTLLAKAVAGEAKVPFFSLSGSDFVEMFVGVGASRVRDLFKQAKEKAPSIIFIDEIDAIGRARGKASFSGGNDERENTLNQLLTEMDGFQTNETVIVLAATNRPEILDRALTRAGRFDRTIYIDLPDLNERKEIFKIHLRRIKYAQGLDIDFLAKQTPGFSGADIANVCNEAALIAARKDKNVVELQDFLDAVDRIVAGLEKKSKIITPEEKKVIAYHEAGHATVSWLLEYAAPLVKVTIVPRGRSLGAAWYLPEERQITTAEQIKDEMCAALGGRAAEKVIFNKVSTGALSDLEKVTRQAQAMVSIFGLNERIGNITYYDSSGQNEFGFSKPYSEKTAEIIDEEIKKIVEEQYQRAIELLTNNKEKLIQLADLLLEKEVIFKQDLEQVFGKRLWDKEHPEDASQVKTPEADSNPENTQKREEELSGAAVPAEESKD